VTWFYRLFDQFALHIRYGNFQSFGCTTKGSKSTFSNHAKYSRDATYNEIRFGGDVPSGERHTWQNWTVAYPFSVPLQCTFSKYWVDHSHEWQLRGQHLSSLALADHVETPLPARDDVLCICLMGEAIRRALFEMGYLGGWWLFQRRDRDEMRCGRVPEIADQGIRGAGRGRE